MEKEIENVKWRMKGLFAGDAKKCYEEVLALETITPNAIVEYAKDPDCELHRCFEWNDGIAAHKWRIYTARNLIGSFVLIRKEPEEQPKRVFQITSEPNTYQPITFFMRNESEYSRLLSRAKDELIAIRNRYNSIAELEMVFEEIDKL